MTGNVRPFRGTVRQALPAVAAALVLFAGSAAPSQVSGPSPAGDVLRLLEPGTAAPDFTLRDTEGVPYTLGEGRGKRAALLYFWSVFCEPCRSEMPLVRKMHDRFGERGLDVVAISLDGEPLRSVVVGVVKQEGYAFRVLIDGTEGDRTFKAADPYGVAGMPTFYLVDRGGKVALARAGRVREEELEKAIQAALRK